MRIEKQITVFVIFVLLGTIYKETTGVPFQDKLIFEGVDVADSDRDDDVDVCYKEYFECIYIRPVMVPICLTRMFLLTPITMIFNNICEIHLIHCVIGESAFNARYYTWIYEKHEWKYCS